MKPRRGEDGSRDLSSDKTPDGCKGGWLLSSALRAEISSPAGEIGSRLCREISSLCERVNFFSSGKEISPGFFRIRGFIYPGSYLLSRDLSSDYHRRADVSLPGSEWDRVGPSGYDHQVAGKCFFLTYSLHRVSGWSCLPLSVLLLRVAVCRAAQLAFGQADIRVAVAMGLSQFRFAFSSSHFFC